MNILPHTLRKKWDGLGQDPATDWRLCLFILGALLLIALLGHVYLFLDTLKVPEAEAPADSAPIETIDAEALKKALDAFRQRGR